MPKRNVTREVPFAQQQPEKRRLTKKAVAWEITKGVANLVGTSAALTAMVKGVAPEARSPIHISKDPTPASSQPIEWQTKERVDNPVKVETVTTTAAVQEMAPQQNAPEFVALALGPEEQNTIHDYMEQVYELLDSDPTLRVTVTVGGRSSDESEIDSKSRGDKGADFGVASQNNEKLAEDYQEKGMAYAEQLSARYGDRITFVEGDSYEVILTEENADRISAIAKSRELSDEEFMIRYEDNREQLHLDKSERDALYELIDKNRGADFSATYTRTVETSEYGECDMIYQQVIHRAEEHIPGSDGWRIDVFAGFVPRLPFRRKKNGQKEDGDSLTESIDQQPEESEIEQPELVSVEHDKEIIVPTEEKLYPVYPGPGQYRIVKVKPLSFAPPSRMRRAVDTVKDYAMLYEDEIKRTAIGAAALAIPAIIPIPYFNETTPTTSHEQLACGTVTVESSHQEFSSLYFPIIEKVGTLFGKDLDTHFMHSVSEVPGSVKTTVDPHYVITLDEDGNKIDEYYVPESDFDGRVDIKNDR